MHTMKWRLQLVACKSPDSSDYEEHFFNGQLEFIAPQRRLMQIVGIDGEIKNAFK